MAGLVDVSVGGHYRAGEHPESRFRRAETPLQPPLTRELREELGLTVAPGVLLPVGRRWMERAGPGWIDREVQDVFAMLLPGPPEGLDPDADEVAALLVVELEELRALVVAERPVVLVRELPVRAAGGVDRPHEAQLMADQLVPADDGYWELMARTLLRLLAGSPAGWFELDDRGAREQKRGQEK